MYNRFNNRWHIFLLSTCGCGRLILPVHWTHVSWSPEIVIFISLIKSSLVKKRIIQSGLVCFVCFNYRHCYYLRDFLHFVTESMLNVLWNNIFKKLELRKELEENPTYWYFATRVISLPFCYITSGCHNRQSYLFGALVQLIKSQSIHDDEVCRMQMPVSIVPISL